VNELRWLDGLGLAFGYLLTMHRHVRRCHDAQTHPVALNCYHSHPDSAIDHNFFPDTTAQN
jgi:hypothetical protein